MHVHFCSATSEPSHDSCRFDLNVAFIHSNAHNVRSESKKIHNNCNERKNITQQTQLTQRSQSGRSVSCVALRTLR